MQLRTITLQNDKLKKHLQDKTDLVIEGRNLTQDIEVIEAGNQIIDNQIKEIEGKVDLKDFEAEAEETVKEMKDLMARMDAIQAKIYDKLKGEVPPELGVKYEANKQLVEKIEAKRKKVGLKIQKLKDLIIPMVQKEAKNLLEDEFEDFSDVRLENGEVVIDIFSHLEEWKEARANKLKEKYLQK